MPRRFRLRLWLIREAKWLVPELRCLTFPLAVSRNRFFVPLCVFILVLAMILYRPAVLGSFALSAQYVNRLVIVTYSLNQKRGIRGKTPPHQRATTPPARTRRRDRHWIAPLRNRLIAPAARASDNMGRNNDLSTRRPRGSPMILHIDMDAFYASVEERDRPELVGKPVIVGGNPEKRGVVAAANYAARTHGVHSAMPATTAHRLCPQGVFLPPRIGYYAEVSSKIREIFERFTPLVEPLSLDEAFLDATGSEHLFGSAVEIGRKIKQAIREELRLVASVGVAPNKFLAKIASDLKKPDGFVVVEPEHVREFLDPLPVERLWGVGKQGSKIFHRLGIHTIGQLRQWPLEAIKRRAGAGGELLWELAHGVDDRPVVPEREAKSISHETTFEHDISDLDLLRAWLVDLVEQVGCRLRRHGLRGRTVNLKVRFADFSTITRSLTLPEPTNLTQELWQSADHMLCRRLPPGHPPVRLLGMGVSGLDDARLIQRTFFDQPEREKLARLDAVTDQIKDRFGSTSLHRGSSPHHDEP